MTVGTNTVVELSLPECWALVARSRQARLAFNGIGVFPVIVAIDYLVRDRTLLFRPRSGAVLAVPLRGAPVTVEVDSTDEAGETGWTVVVSGHIDELTTGDEVAVLGGQSPGSEASGPEHGYLRLTASRVSGNRMMPQDSAEFWWDSSEEA